MCHSLEADDGTLLFTMAGAVLRPPRHIDHLFLVVVYNLVGLSSSLPVYYSGSPKLTRLLNLFLLGLLILRSCGGFEAFAASSKYRTTWPAVLADLRPGDSARRSLPSKRTGRAVAGRAINRLAGGQAGLAEHA